MTYRVAVEGTAKPRPRRVVALMVLAALIALGVVGALVLHFLSLGPIEGPATAGGLYSVVTKPGEHGILKVLKVEPDVVHVRLYKGRWPSRPTHIDPAALTTGTVDDEDGGIGHVPLALRIFDAMQPRLLLVAEVTPQELDGYEEWKKAGGR
jgi:hypothetical protein